MGVVEAGPGLRGVDPLLERTGGDDDAATQALVWDGSGPHQLVNRAGVNAQDLGGLFDAVGDFGIIHGGPPVCVLATDC